MTDAPEMPDITAPKRWRVTMADKTVHELILGAPDGAGYFARSKQLPGDTFVVGKSVFEAIRRDGKKYFAKPE